MTKIVAALFSALFVLAGPSLQSLGAITTPEQLIAEFYGHLLSEVSSDKLPKLFAEPITSASSLEFASALESGNPPADVLDEGDAVKKVWEYLRENKKLFLFDGVEPSMILKKTRLSYIFEAFPSAATFFDGMFSVELTGLLSKGGKDGVYKRIRFPLIKNENPTGPRYLIDVTVITVNGVMIDLTNESDRSGNLYEQLGFESTK